MEPSSDPLAQLKDIHLPPEIGYWPPSFGWWIVLVALLLAITFLFVNVYTRWKKGKAKRQALAHLKTISEQSDQWHIELNTLLKRAALSYFEAGNVASLHSDTWTNFMASRLPVSKQTEFIQTFSKLQASLYSGKPAVDFERSAKQTSIWLNYALPPKTSKPNLSKGEPSHV